MDVVLEEFLLYFNKSKKSSYFYMIASKFLTLDN